MMLRFICLLASLCVTQTLAFGQFGQAAIPPQSLAAQSAAAQSAVSGEPFGVFSLEVPLPPAGPEWDADGLNVLVGDSAGRVYFPTYEVITSRQAVPTQPGSRQGLGLGIGRPGGLIDRIRDAVQPETTLEEVPSAIRIHGLFSGSEDLDVQVEGDVSYKTRLAVTNNSQSRSGTGSHRSALVRWWSAYVSHARAEFERGDFPSLFHRYMLSMLAQRLNVPYSDLDPPKEDEQESESVTLKTLSLIAAIDARRERILENLLTPTTVAGRADQPVPSPPAWSEDLRLQAKRPVGALPEIEPIATRVPPECMYLRFGSFRNYVWFQEMAERFGGDLAQAVQMRGFSAQATARMEKMLATKLTTVAKMFGDQLVQDMALVGTDLYVKEGASLGVILHATNPALLITTTQSERKRTAAETPDAQIQTVKIEGRDVSLLSTPDNRIRSFFVADGNFLLVTTSEHIVKRFLQVADGGESLAGAPEFQWTRQWMPATQDYSVFAYFSPRFLQGLVSPKYQIELSRRLEALGRIEIATVAKQAAEAEGRPSESLVELQAEGFLPADFLDSSDGSQPILTRDGQWIDSVRGARGSFLPIADMRIEQVTAAEANSYEETANFFSQEWQQMDPMVFGLRRFRGSQAGHETVAVEGYVAPFDADKYGWIGKQLGAPTTIRFRQPASDLVSAQVHMRAGAGLASSDTDYYLLGGLKDTRLPELGKVDGILNKFTAFASVPAYIGAWPKPDLVESLPLGIGRNFSRPDYEGYSRLRIGLWRWQNEALSLLSFDRSILDEARSIIAPENSADNAQVRLKVQTLLGTELGGWINDWWYRDASKASDGNVILLHAVSQQLKVRPAEAKQVAESLLDVTLQCPKGGEYQLVANARGIPLWQSSAPQARTTREAVHSDGAAAQVGYVAPWVNWFRGGQLHITQGADSLALVGQLDMEMPPLPKAAEAKPSELPAMDFNLFNLPGKLFGGSDEKKAEADKPKRRSF